ncbi:MAG TPA: hypothetical protein VNN79_22905 [Actinomycetota bacterium]|nr:hypothetical protein [Actinomycetota bacterium]
MRLHPRLTLLLEFAVVVVTGPSASAVGVTASFAGSTLTIAGDAGGGTVPVVRDLAGTIHVFLGPNEVAVSGGPATVTNTDFVTEQLQPADDFTSDMSQGPFAPGVTVPIRFNGGFVDVIRGGGGADAIQGGLGPDRMLGGGSDDTIVGVDGTSGNDVVNGQAGHDYCNGDPGDTVTKCEEPFPSRDLPR